jgi:hypothetical protein
MHEMQLRYAMRPPNSRYDHHRFPSTGEWPQTLETQTFLILGSYLLL